MRRSKILAVIGLTSSMAASYLNIRAAYNETAVRQTVTCNHFKQNFSNITYLSSDTGYTAENEGIIMERSSLYNHARKRRTNVIRSKGAAQTRHHFCDTRWRGGGMSFFSYEYGFASTNGNVRSFKCVLADGSIVSATANNSHADIYWALQGGGNPFCIVTKFDLRTFDQPSSMLAEATYGSGADIEEQWLDSILNYVLNGPKDMKAAIIPLARFGTGFTAPTYGSTLYYNGNASTPAIFNDSQGGLLPSLMSTNLTAISVAEFGELVTPAFKAGGESYGLQQRFHVISTQATIEAMPIVHDTYFDAAYKLGDLTDISVSLAFNAITTKFIEASNSGIGCPQGVEEIPLFWVEQSLSWENPADDAIIEEFVQAVNDNMTAQLSAINGTAKYNYPNDADPDQPVFEGYPVENVKRLKDIRDRYDPAMIYTNQMAGGFKVAHAETSAVLDRGIFHHTLETYRL